MKNNEIGIVILSCDKYSDLWDGFFAQLNKFFNIPNNKYLISNSRTYINKKVNNLTVIKTGEDANWSSSLLAALEQIPDSKILVILEDIYLTDHVDISLFKKIQEFVFTDDAQHIKVFSGPKATNLMSADFLMRYSPGTNYLVTINGIWDKKLLQELLIPGESAWQFEVNGSYRAQFYANKFYNLRKNLLPNVNMVEKGKWVPSSIRWAKKNDVNIQLDARILASEFRHILKKIYFDFVFSTPWHIRQKITDLIKKALITY